MLALWTIAARVRRAQQGHPVGPGELVDVISLSLGHFDESGADAVYTTALAAIIDELLAARDRRGDALAALRAGLDDVADHRGRLGSLDFRVGTAALGVELASAGLRASPH